MDYIEHSAKGSTWTKKNHKYIRKEGNRYIYDDDQKKAARQRNALKGRKFVQKDPITGEIRRSGNAQMRSFDRKTLAETRDFLDRSQKVHEQFMNETDKNEKDFVKAANDNQYRFLKAVDDGYYQAVKKAKQMEDPKAWKSLIKKAKKMNLETLEMVSKEYTDNSLKGRLAKRKISKLKKQMNSKSMERMIDMVSKISAKFTKIKNKSFLKTLDKARKKTKKAANAQHKQWLEQNKKEHNQWKSDVNASHDKWTKDGLNSVNKLLRS